MRALFATVLFAWVLVGIGCEKKSAEGRTWTDPATGLEWQTRPTGGEMNWGDAKSHCSELSVAGGGWRLPTVGELRSLIRGCPGNAKGGMCKVDDDCLGSVCRRQGGEESCSSCLPGRSQYRDGCYRADPLGGKCLVRWSSSAVADIDNNAWFVSFQYGDIFNYDVTNGGHVRCVR